MFSNVLYCLLRHPPAHARLRAEVDARCPPERDALDPAQLAQMPYLDAVM